MGNCCQVNRDEENVIAKVETHTSERRDEEATKFKSANMKYSQQYVIDEEENEVNDYDKTIKESRNDLREEERAQEVAQEKEDNNGKTQEKEVSILDEPNQVDTVDNARVPETRQENEVFPEQVVLDVDIIQENQEVQQNQEAQEVLAVQEVQETPVNTDTLRFEVVELPSDTTTTNRVGQVIEIDSNGLAPDNTILPKLEVNYDRENKFSVKNVSGSAVLRKLSGPVVLDDYNFVAVGKSTMSIKIKKRQDEKSYSEVKLTFVEGPAKGSNFIFNSSETQKILIGRNEKSSVYIKDETISRLNTTLVYSESDSTWSVVDGDGTKNSVNGTWILLDKFVKVEADMIIKSSGTVIKAL